MLPESRRGRPCRGGLRAVPPLRWMRSARRRPFRPPPHRLPSLGRGSFPALSRPRHSPPGRGPAGATRRSAVLRWTSGSGGESAGGQCGCIKRGSGSTGDPERWVAPSEAAGEAGMADEAGGQDPDVEAAVVRAAGERAGVLQEAAGGTLQRGLRQRLLLLPQAPQGHGDHLPARRLQGGLAALLPRPRARLGRPHPLPCLLPPRRHCRRPRRLGLLRPQRRPQAWCPAARS